ncbi:hypothetical protein KI387_029166, partial [Taxus chinensis]
VVRAPAENELPEEMDAEEKKEEKEATSSKEDGHDARGDELMSQLKHPVKIIEKSYPLYTWLRFG